RSTCPARSTPLGTPTGGLCCSATTTAAAPSCTVSTWPSRNAGSSRRSRAPSTTRACGPTANSGTAGAARPGPQRSAPTAGHCFAVGLGNYRGSTGYGRAWREAFAGDPGFTELADVAAVRDQAVARGLADPARLVLAGGSWGGYITLLGLGTQPEKWSLGIASVPLADHVATYEDEMEPLKAAHRALFGGTPRERPEFYRVRSAITYVDRVAVPVLILAG